MGGMPRRIGLLLSLLGFVVCLYLLITESELLDTPIWRDGDISLGIFIAWGAYLSLTFGIYFSYPPLMYPMSGFERFMKVGWIVLLISCLAWPWLGYAMAGGSSFRFSPGSGLQERWDALMFFTYFSVILAISLLLWPLLILLNLLLRKRNP